MGGINLFGSETKNTTKVTETNTGGTFDTAGTGHGTVTGNENKQVLASGNALAGANNRQVRVTGKGLAGTKNHQTNTSGFGAGGSIAGKQNQQTIGRGNAFQGADMSRANARGDISHLGDHSSIGGDFYNRDFDLELNAAPGATINYEVGDSGVSEAITDLGRALGRTSYGGVQALDNAIGGQQNVEISKQILYAIIAGFVGILMLRK